MRLSSRSRWRPTMALAAVAVCATVTTALPATPAAAAVPCQVDYRSNPWHESAAGGGFSASITITVLSAPIAEWALTFALPAGQTLRTGWSANWPPAGTGGQLTATSQSWNGRLGTGQSTQIGFVGSWSGVHTDPTTFHLNGVLCNQEEPDPVERVANPYQGAGVFVNPDWAAQVRAQAAATSGTLGQQMTRVASYPTAVWLDDIDAITAGRGLAGYLDEALAQQAGGGGPMVVQLVLYNVPGRDCAGRAAPGELTFEPVDQARYRTAFIDPIVQTLALPRYAGLRLVVVVEPGALPGLLFDRSQGFLDCEIARTSNAYVDAVRYALRQLAGVPNVYSYLEVPYSGLGGYPDNFRTFANLYTQVVAGSGGPGVASVAGFVTNAAQYVPLAEPFLPDPNLVVGGVPILQTRFLDFNPHYQELAYAQVVREAFLARGFRPEVGMLVDTGRNGWGGADRPTQASISRDASVYVDESRIDRRPNRLSWCNQVGAGLGERPAVEPAAGVHAYVWLTPPGESDGVSSPAAAPDPDRPYLRHHNPCDPLWSPPQGSLIRSNAVPDAPHYRRWFPAMFAQLVRNAHPPVPTV